MDRFLPICAVADEAAGATTGRWDPHRSGRLTGREP